MNKNELIDALTEREIEHDPNATNKELQTLLDNAPEMVTPVEIEPEVMAEKPKDMDEKNKNFASQPVNPSTGNPDVEVKAGQVKKIVDEKEIIELQKNGVLCGYNPATKEAVYWK